MQSMAANRHSHTQYDCQTKNKYLEMCVMTFDIPYRFHSNSEGVMMPEMTEVAEFMETLLEDCSHNPEESFLALRVCFWTMSNVVITLYPAAESEMAT